MKKFTKKISVLLVLVFTISLTVNAQDSPLLFSEYAEGSGNNKYLEIYNSGSESVSLADYALARVTNAPSVVGEYETWSEVFPADAEIAPGDVYVVAHSSADPPITSVADVTFNSLSNGDDGFALVMGTQESHVYVDWVGDFDGDPGSGWPVCDASNGTQNSTLVRKCGVNSGSPWSISTSPATCEWEVLPSDDFSNLGSHTADCNSVVSGCTDSQALNYSEAANLDDGSCEYTNGCSDSLASNYDSNAVVDDGSCTYAVGVCQLDNVYISEAHGSGEPNDYIEIFNAGDSDCSLLGYKLDDWEGLQDLTFGYVVVPAGGYWLGYEDAEGSFSSGIGGGGDNLYLADTSGTYKMVSTLDGDLGATNFTADGTACSADPTPGADNAACTVFAQGCTDAAATNYSADAQIDDGSCEYELSVDLSCAKTEESLQPGDIAIVSYNADGDDAVSLLFLADVAPGVNLTVGQEEYNNDSGWSGGSEGASQFTVPASGISAGTVVSVAMSGLSSSGDQAFIFVGDQDQAVGKAIYGVEMNGGFDATNCPPELTVGTTALANLSEVDNSAWNMGLALGTKVELLSAISDGANWNTDNSNPVPLPEVNISVSDGCESSSTSVSSCVLGTVYISEAHGSGDPEDYIEVYNSGDTDCSMLGFMLDDEQPFDDFTFGDVVIPAGGYWLGYEDEEGSFGSGIGKGGDNLYLGTDSTNVLMVETLDGDLGATNFDAAGTACSAEPTPGADNAACTVFVEGCTDSTATNYSADANLDNDSCEYPVVYPSCVLGTVYISEAHGSGYPEDYIEIYNSGDADCSMLGFMLDDEQPFDDFTFGDVVIPAGGYWVGYEDMPASFGSGIGSGGDNLYLGTDSTNVLMVETLPGDMGATNFTADGTACSADPTPGADNAECTSFDVLGCMEEDAYNYDSLATVSDASCIYSGCTDTAATNYNADADLVFVDDGSCLYSADYVNNLSTTEYINVYLSMPEGWSMFGYTCLSPMNASEGLLSINDKVTIAKDYMGNAYLPDWGFNAIGEFEYGEGYQIKLTEEVNEFQFCPVLINSEE